VWVFGSRSAPAGSAHVADGRCVGNLERLHYRLVRVLAPPLSPQVDRGDSLEEFIASDPRRLADYSSPLLRLFLGSLGMGQRGVPGASLGVELVVEAGGASLILDALLDRLHQSTRGHERHRRLEETLL